ncbi:unnamed protein product [Bemisia tabaci]|uniref:Outer dense fiber protein 3 n=1 Tax=Bemisia tabaci TaxID=7038 RepID=A0A9P0AK45_BEMTA|nr:unnamed protein product [Bemisia tabaci]
MGGFQQRTWTPTKRRGPIAAEFTGPGPACVTLPSLVGSGTTPDSKKGRAPAFSFGSRHSGKNDSIGPGPGQYNITGLSAKGKDTPPAATLHSRPKETKIENFPAPGDYNPEKSEKVIADSSPKYTFGLKTSVDKPNTTPAPGTYCPEKSYEAFDHTIQYSFGLKTQIEKPLNTPGPGTYNNANADSIKPKSPAYSVSSRYQMPGDTTPKPGPGAYSPEKVQLDLPPAHTFGIRHSPYIGSLREEVH